ncbi:hypothetical protein QD357_04660 [Rhizobium sp. BR 317]|uniref:Uncharacterized protein n=3 Tax=Rhizobium TaxID=379 RepID=A0A7W9D0I1_9HYPH|nr:hypothetical protein [Rhizobium paranaense]
MVHLSGAEREDATHAFEIRCHDYRLDALSPRHAVAPAFDCGRPAQMVCPLAFDGLDMGTPTSNRCDQNRRSEPRRANCRLETGTVAHRRPAFWNVDCEGSGNAGGRDPSSVSKIVFVGCTNGRLMMPADVFSCEYSFDELTINLCDRWETGLLLYGRAELTSAGDGYDGEFYVSAIRLDGGARLARPHPLGNAGGFEAELFRRIAAVIENDKTLAGRQAAELFAIEYGQSTETDYDIFRKIEQERILEPVA